MRQYLFILIFLALIVGCSPQDKVGKEQITWAVGKDATGAQGELIKLFESRYPAYKVNMIEMPESASTQHDSYVTYLSTADSSIDIYTIDVIWPAEFAAAEWIIPLDNYLKPIKKDDFLKGPIDACIYQGKLYAIPWFTDAGVLYYRKDILGRENLTPPRTWQELIDQAMKLQEKYKIHGFVFQAQQYEGLICNFLEYVWGNGGSIERDGKFDIANPRARQALQFMVDIIHKYKIAPGGVITYKEEESRQIFTSGKAVFHRNWPYVWAIAQNEAKGSMVKDKVGIIPMVHNVGCKSSSVLGGWNLAISKYSKNKQAAWKFIEFLSSYEAQKLYAIKGGRLPTRKDVYQDEEVLRFAPHYRDFYQVFISARPRPVSPYYSQISDLLQIELHQALTLRKTAEEALIDASKKIEEVVRQQVP